MSRSYPKRLFLLTTFAAASTVFACSPNFPNQLLAQGDVGVLTMPPGNFAQELARLRPSPATVVPASPTGIPAPGSPSTTADLRELRLAIKAAETPDADAVLKGFSAVRAAIDAYDQTPATTTATVGADAPVVPMPAVTIPGGLPAEFDEYIRGLVALKQADVESARAHWRRVLSLPAGERKHRTVWAAYMLGRSYQKTDPSEAIEWFAATRDFYTAGCSDELNLFAASLGWQARAELDAGRFSRALDLYFRQYCAGDSSAEASLQIGGRAALAAGPSALAEVAADPVARQVVTACILCQQTDAYWWEFTPAQLKLVLDWLGAVEAGAVRDMPGSDRLAWMAYLSGDFGSAARWAARSPGQSVVGQWVRAKLLLRAGKADEAAALLATLVRAFPTEPRWLAENGLGDRETLRPGRRRGGDDDGGRVDPALDVADNIVPPIVGDLAQLHLGRGQYGDALLLLLRGDFWMDSAYVAERVLTVDELKKFVDQHCASDGAETDGAPFFPEASTKLRCLLGRRLTRAGRPAEARPYYPEPLQKTLDSYTLCLGDGADKTRPDADRAASLMTAARLARTSGMELIGTELAPDWACYGGEFEFEKNDRKPGPVLVGPTNDEIVRVAANAPADGRRFHYCYVAADLAWSAIELMEPDTDATAAALCEAGNWIKNRDAKAANRFYKALVRRCPSTDLGQRAAKSHWFPPK